MRLGCSGCLATLALLVMAAAGVVSSAWMVMGIFEAPRPEVPGPTAADGVRAEQKLQPLLGGHVRGRTVVLTEAEANSLISHSISDAALGIPVLRVVSRLGGGGSAEIRVQTPVRTLVHETIPTALNYLPERWTAWPVWLVVVVTPRVETGTMTSRRSLRLSVSEFHVGTRRLPVGMMGMLVDPAAFSGLRWTLPIGVDQVVVERGHVILRGGS